MAGSNQAVMSGYVRIVNNDETWYGEPRFNFLSAPVGAAVYFEQLMTLIDATFTPDLFQRGFQATTCPGSSISRRCPSQAPLCWRCSASV